ncbi:hypothetical protein PAMP_019039 [Pampus punctatissimus]
MEVFVLQLVIVGAENRLSSAPQMGLRLLRNKDPLWTAVFTELSQSQQTWLRQKQPPGGRSDSAAALSYQVKRFLAGSDWLGVKGQQT